MGNAQRVVVEGAIGVAGQLGVSIVSSNGYTVPLAPYDSQKVSNPGANAQASIVFPATPGQRWMLHSFIATLRTGGAVVAAYTQILQILDNAVSFYDTQLSNPTATTATTYNVDRLAEVGLAYVSTVGKALTIQFTSASGANTIQYLSAGAYLID
jgi:hypothetical protein